MMKRVSFPSLPKGWLKVTVLKLRSLDIIAGKMSHFYTTPSLLRIKKKCISS